MLVVVVVVVVAVTHGSRRVRTHHVGKTLQQVAGIVAREES